MSKYVYSVTTENGSKSKCIIIRVLPTGKIKLIADVSLNLKKMERVPWSKKQQDTTKQTVTVAEIGEAMSRQIEPEILPDTGNEPEIIVPPAIPVDNSENVYVGDSIEINLNGEATKCKVVKTFDEDQEIGIQLAGGDKLIIPAAWFIRKV